MLKQLQRWFHFYFLKKELKFHHPPRKTISLRNANEIGILFDASDPDKVSVINNFAETLKRDRKRIVMLGFYNVPKQAINFNFTYFNKKNVNWHLEPYGDLVDAFIARKFDILINAFVGENLPLEYVSAMSEASFRMGTFHKEKTYAYDFMIDLKGESDLQSLVSQYRHYLTCFDFTTTNHKMIHKKLRGTGVALITPFKKNGAVDYKALEKLIHFNIENGINYFVSLGTTGESVTLNEEEKKEIWKFTAKVVNGKVPLVAGIGGNDTKKLADEMRPFRCHWL